jgi:predicted RNA-binding Zn-ribbon protein involved in translation (DUF1610 family)
VFRCPNCGNLIYGHTRYHENLTCPSCSARLRIRASHGMGPFALFFLFVFLLVFSINFGFGLFWLFILFCFFPAVRRKVEVVQLNTPTVRQSYPDRSGRSESSTTLIRPSTVDQQPDLALGQRTSRYCSYCGATISMPNWKFCQNCGASLSTETAESFRSNEQGKVRGDSHAGRCMVCGLNLGNNGPVAFCPHCGNAAHRTHLLEWLHVKKYCPVCGQHLTEREI